MSFKKRLLVAFLLFFVSCAPLSPAVRHEDHNTADAWLDSPEGWPANCAVLSRTRFFEVDESAFSTIKASLESTPIVPLSESDLPAIVPSAFTRPAGLKPFLVRAVASNPSTGAFSLCVAEDIIYVSHVSLGEAACRRSALVVFLENEPRRVFIHIASVL